MPHASGVVTWCNSVTVENRLLCFSLERVGEANYNTYVALKLHQLLSCLESSLQLNGFLLI